MGDELQFCLYELIRLTGEYRKLARTYTLRRFSALGPGRETPPALVDMTEWDHTVLRLIAEHQSDEELNSKKLRELIEQVEEHNIDERETPLIHASKISQVLNRLSDSKGGYGLIRKEGRNARPELTPLGHQVTLRLDEAETLILPQLANLIREAMPTPSLEKFSQTLRLAIERFRSSSPKGTVAGVYDCALGGANHNYLDRIVVDSLEKEVPFAKPAAVANRAFMRRAVQCVSHEGIHQFIDIGSGLPTAGNTHEIAQWINPEAKILYVDNDSSVVAHSNRILSGLANARTICRDIADIDAIFDDVEMKHKLEGKQGIDLGKPVAVVLVAILHFLKDDELVARILRSIKSRVCEGSYLIISHGTTPPPESGMSAERLEQVYGKMVHQLRLRSKKEIEALFKGTKLIDPEKLVFTTQWRPTVPDRWLPSDYKPFSDDDAWKSSAYAGVGRVLKK